MLEEGKRLFPMPLPFPPRIAELPPRSSRKRGRAVARARAESLVNMFVGWSNYVVLGTPKSRVRYFPLALRRKSSGLKGSDLLHLATYGVLTRWQRETAESLVVQVLPMVRSRAFFERALGRGPASLSALLEVLALEHPKHPM